MNLFYVVIFTALVLEKNLTHLKMSWILIQMLDFSANDFIFVELTYLYGKNRYLTIFLNPQSFPTFNSIATQPLL